MSGGAFDYKYSQVEMFCEELGQRIKNNKVKDEWGYCANLKPATIKELKRILKWCKIASQLMYEAEWLYSGDTGDESFMQRIRKIK